MLHPFRNVRCIFNIVVVLFPDVVSMSGYVASNGSVMDEQWIRKAVEGSVHGPIEVFSRYLTNGLRKPTRNLTLDSRYASRSLNPAHPDYKSRGAFLNRGSPGP
jgi:hypothetical protein